jgi:flagellar biosynthesis GTPase FlhF
MTKIWSTDKDGNDVVKERKARKSSDPKKKKESKKKESKDMDEFSVDELAALLAKKKEEKKKEAEEKEKKKEEKEKKEKEKEEKEKKEKDEKTDGLAEAKDKLLKMSDDMKDDDEYEDITFDGVEYQLNKEDNTVVRCEDFEGVGVWNTETETIDFYDDEDE